MLFEKDCLNPYAIAYLRLRWDSLFKLQFSHDFFDHRLLLNK